MLNLDYPLFLLGLPLPWLVLRFVPALTQRQSALRAPFFQQWQSIQQEQAIFSRSSKITLFLLWSMWLALLLACARPQWIGEPVSLPTSGRDLLVAVDISGSMKADDMEWRGQQVTRLQIVKAVVSDFVKRRENDRLGLVLFGSQAYLQAPLTFDRNTVEQLLREAQLGFAGEKTAIGDAIGLATKRLMTREENHRVLILLTDGANTAGEITPQKAADLAKLAGVKIYTVGVGAEFIENPSFFGMISSKRRNTELDEDALRYIAQTTGGEYFRAKNTEQLQQIYQHLDTLEPVEQDAETFRPIKDLFFWPLSLVLLLASLLWLHGERNRQ